MNDFLFGFTIGTANAALHKLSKVGISGSANVNSAIPRTLPVKRLSRDIIWLNNESYATNCRNCGAPLKSRFSCAYCGTMYH